MIIERTTARQRLEAVRMADHLETHPLVNRAERDRIALLRQLIGAHPTLTPTDGADEFSAADLALVEAGLRRIQRDVQSRERRTAEDAILAAAEVSTQFSTQFSGLTGQAAGSQAVTRSALRLVWAVTFTGFAVCVGAVVLAARLPNWKILAVTPLLLALMVLFVRALALVADTARGTRDTAERTSARAISAHFLARGIATDDAPTIEAGRRLLARSNRWSR